MYTYKYLICIDKYLYIYTYKNLHIDMYFIHLNINQN